MATIPQQIAYEQAKATRIDSASCLLSAFRTLGLPDSLFDVGCGPGHLVQIADALGIWAEGVDISLTETIRMPDRSVIYPGDVTTMSHPSHTFAMVLCLEVAEHLQPDEADALCDLLVQSTKGTLLFSAATPGQGGSGHYNEQPHEYWIEKLQDRGLTYVWAVTEALRGDWSQLAPRSWWYGRNIMVFRRA